MPLYTNNENLRVVDMCKTFDEEFPTSNRDDTKLFKYLYLIIYAVTLKEKPNWFQTYEDYDGYATYSAKTLYIRFIKQEKEGKKIKSVLNYFHGAMNGLRINYQKETFVEIIDPVYDEFDSQRFLDDVQSDLSDEYYSEYKEEEITRLLCNVDKTAREVVLESPFPKEMQHRLYISVLMTFLSNITINNKTKARFARKIDRKAKDIDEAFIGILEKEKQEEPILWRLPKEMGDYVRMLVNKLRFNLAKELKDIQSYYILPEDVVTGIMASAYGDSYNQVKEEL